MRFNCHQFSTRFPPVVCAFFVLHEPYFRASEPFTLDEKVTRGTAAAIILEDGRFWIGVSLCSPNDDFVKKIGRAKAVGRAYQLMRAGQDGTDYLYEDGRIEFRVGSSEQLTLDWNTKLRERLQAEINETKRKIQYGPVRSK